MKSFQLIISQYNYLIILIELISEILWFYLFDIFIKTAEYLKYSNYLNIKSTVF
jgi:hypothetical protein